MIPTSEENLIWQTALAVAQDVGAELPPIEIEIRNEIPIGKGLGSSAAALTAGVVIADHLLGLQWKPPRILDEAARSRAIRITWRPACWAPSSPAPSIRAASPASMRLELPAAFRAGRGGAGFHSPHHKPAPCCRRLLQREDAVFNVQRASLLIAALATGTTTAFPAALEDRFHQPYRVPLVPGLDKILKLRAPGLLGCVLSGAGPSILVFYERGYEQVCDLVRQVFHLHGHASEILHTCIADRGFELEESA